MFQVKTVNLPLSGTVLEFCRHLLLTSAICATMSQPRPEGKVRRYKQTYMYSVQLQQK